MHKQTYRFQLDCTDTSVSEVDIAVLLAVKVQEDKIVKNKGKIVKNLEKMSLK